jgi:opacity protein-like surface antigen
MKIRFLLAALVATTLLSLAASAALAQSVYTRGYYRSNGTYVQPHYSSRPDGNTFNNYGTRGNYNPYTGATGTRNPYPSYTTPSYSTYGRTRTRRPY